MIDEDHKGPLAHDSGVGLDLALRVHRAELPRRLDRDAERLLPQCTTRAEYERRLDDLVDHILERAPMAREPGLLRGLVITSAGVDGEIEISGEDGEEVTPERIEKALAAYKWELKADLRRAVEKDVGPLLEVRKRYWLRRFDERAEGLSGSVAFPAVIEAAYTIEALPSPQQPQLAPAPKGKRGRPPFPDEKKRSALAVLKGAVRTWTRPGNCTASGAPTRGSVGAL